MEGPGDELLAGAAFTQDEDVGLVAADTGDRGIHLGHRLRRPRQAEVLQRRRCGRPSFRARCFCHQPLEARQNQLGGERRRDEVGGPHLHGVDRLLQRGVLLPAR